MKEKSMGLPPTVLASDQGDLTNLTLWKADMSLNYAPAKISIHYTEKRLI